MIFRYNLFIRKMRLFAKFYTHKNINQVTPRGAERMKEIIFKDSLQKYLAEKMKKQMICFAVKNTERDILRLAERFFFMLIFCQSTSRKNFKSAIIMLFVELIRKQRGSRPCGKSSEMRARALIAVLFL